MGTSLHWISSDWKLKHLAISLEHLEGSHSGRYLSEVFTHKLEKFGILHKV
jgi:hypothetical protein